MWPKTHIMPHHSLTNCVLQGHLGLMVTPSASIRVGEFIASNFEFQLFLSVEFWHPDLNAEQQKSVPYIL
ncbi:unnamed protein product [Soboliphyme baturini]|uniref:Asp_Arg_Hydrox domain-containing protein n=1 Tax=Soboliphyme baturini TaxID=241478 RepID=A0A183IP98_9BILA|nr:unnamed protein product [Soboliphyme baturini]